MNKMHLGKNTFTVKSFFRVTTIVLEICVKKCEICYDVFPYSFWIILESNEKSYFLSSGNYFSLLSIKYRYAFYFGV